MKKIFHKNQIIVTTLALLVAVGGYLSFSLNQKDDKEAASFVEPQDDIANTALTIQIESNTFFIVILFKLNIGANI